MDPESEEVCREGGTLVGGEEEALEHVAQVSQVEDVVELDCRWRKHLVARYEEGGCNKIRTEPT